MILGHYKECIRPTEVPVPLLTRVVNLARVMDLLYKVEDAYTSWRSDGRGYHLNAC